MWWVPIVAAIASTAVGSGMNKLMAGSPKPKEAPPPGGLGSTQEANAKMAQAAVDPLQEDVLSQYLARLSQNRMA